MRPPNRWVRSVTPDAKKRNRRSFMTARADFQGNVQSLIEIYGRRRCSHEFEKTENVRLLRHVVEVCTGFWARVLRDRRRGHGLLWHLVRLSRRSSWLFLRANFLALIHVFQPFLTHFCRPRVRATVSTHL